MPLRGRAFLSLWSGVLQGYERELDRWHTIEHMPERLGVPGFLRGRRYMGSRSSDHPAFVLYEAAHIETFRSPSYLARLNDPTDWSKKVQPGLVNFLRSPCHTLISRGDGLGGALMAIRISRDVADTAEVSHSLASAAPAIARLHGVTAVHIGQHVPEIASGETAETRLRPAASARRFSFVVLVEGIGSAEL
ncbi:MAG TPA: hypothetical protein VK466_15430 [Terriglobales bacterium]|nr:hypothetical protein [Terriglobales bacterium]